MYRLFRKTKNSRHYKQNRTCGMRSRVATKNFRKNAPLPSSYSLSNVRIFLIGDNNVRVQCCEKPQILCQWDWLVQEIYWPTKSLLELQHWLNPLRRVGLQRDGNTRIFLASSLEWFASPKHFIIRAAYIYIYIYIYIYSHTKESQ